VTEAPMNDPESTPSRGRRPIGDAFDHFDKLRRGPFRADAFSSPLRTERNAAIFGIALGTAFGLCFLTGLLSHAIQNPPSWFSWPSRPAGLYRITQGIHVASGLAAIPLLLAKLWTVYAKLFHWPPVENIAHVVERVSLFPLVAGAVFMLFSGFANVLNWYPWQFFFPAGHYWGAWITIGALVVHVGAKSTVAWSALRRPVEEEPAGSGITRRGFIRTVFATTGVVTLVTVGQTFRPLARLGLLAPRDPRVGPQGFPVNKSAREARVAALALDPDYRLEVTGRVRLRLSLSLDGLQRLPQHEATLPIACVEGWSANATWRGVRLRDLLEAAGAPDDAECRVESLQPRGIYRTSNVNRAHARDRDTLLALEANGEPLHIDHGYPVRLIGPNRPGVMQTKWVHRIVVL
jgi:DMSO/TMAO reductase YedYZ molybdopterin-dependent catalytic subunit